MTSEAVLIDNMEYMSRFPDKFFDLAVVDPPYGIGETWKKNRKGCKSFTTKYKNQSPPDDKYFCELFRVSLNWIIWGANYFLQVWPCKNIIVWDKVCTIEKDFKQEIELAATSMTHRPSCKYTQDWSGARKGNETGIKIIHPHQKPISLYKWIYSRYAKPGMKILDTHLGSGSNRIAAYDMGLEFYSCELDPDYFAAQEKRFKDHRIQMDMFSDPVELWKIFNVPASLFGGYDDTQL